MKCVVCRREAGERGYCELHAKAYENVITRYEVWRNALEIPWEEYLSKISKNPITGKWAKEVAEHLMRSGEKQSVT